MLFRSLMQMDAGVAQVGDLTAILGCDAEDELVHRNNLVLL